MLNRMIAAACLGLGLINAGSALAADKVVLQFGWFAEPDSGGFLQAQKAGIYAKHGLDVDIRMGGPQINGPQLLAAGKVDFIAGSSADALNAQGNGVPLVGVDGLFQKDPRVLISHKGAGNDTLEAMKGKPILLAAIDQVTFWPFLKAKYGYTDQQIRPYTFNPQPFLASDSAIQQGFVTSEPFSLKKEGAHINVFLLSDYGYQSYGSVLTTTQTMIDQHPDVVQRFVDATNEGWHDYLHGDPKPANDAIKQLNSEMTDDMIAYAIDTMKQNGILESGDALKGGIGAMTDAHWQAIYQQGASLGLVPKTLDYKKAYTLRFVDAKKSQ